MITFSRWLAIALSAISSGAWGFENAPGPDARAPRLQQQARIAFDIPSQSLRDAILRYSELTGVAVMSEPKLLERHVSVTVTGILAPDEALSRLLQGTRLLSRKVGVRVVLLLPGGMPVPGGAIKRVAALDHEPFSALLQAAIIKTLCQSRDQLSARAVMRLWFDNAGRVTHAVAADATGDAAREARLVATLKGVSLGVPWPPGLLQPANIVIDPWLAPMSGCEGKPQRAPQ